MIIVRLAGGMGNQMFQYAAGRALALRKKTSLELDLEFLLDRTPCGAAVFRDFDLGVFAMNPVRASGEEVERFVERSRYREEVLHRIRCRLFPVDYLCEPHFHFYERFFDSARSTYLCGYWQSAKYFNEYELTIRKDFSFRYPVLCESQLLLTQIMEQPSVCVHVRRTDYLANSFVAACDLKYFESAMCLMRQRLNAPRFFVFSDDPDWCAQHFVMSDTTVVGREHSGVKSSNHLQLMTHCRHFIISNSSFAWWAVWLHGGRDKIVVAPSIWFVDPKIDTSDLIPKDWIRIES